jgi:predicted porin
LAYDTMAGRTLGSATDVVFAGLTSSTKTDTRVTVNGYVKFSNLKIGGGLIRRHNDGNLTRPRSDLWFLGATYPLSAGWTLDAAVMKLAYQDAENADASLLAVRALYKSSKRTTLYAQLGGIQNDDQSSVSVSGGAPGSTPAPGGSQTGLMLGVNHQF